LGAGRRIRSDNMQKQELIERINQIKDFELKEVAIKREDGDWIPDPKWNAVCVKGESDIISTVSNRYQLVQFRDVFNPIIHKLPENITGQIATYRGKAWLYIFPDSPDQHKVGITLRNSVDKSTAVEARFSVLVNGFYITIPKQIKAFRKVHTGKALQITQDFLQGLGDIRNFWNDVVRRYNEFAVDSDTTDEILKELKMTKKMKDRVKSYVITNLWELFMAVLKELSLKSYKSDIHKNKKIERIVEIFYNFSVASRI
jgi:hypothetical protein